MPVTLLGRRESSASTACLLEGGGPLHVQLALLVLNVVPFAVARELSDAPRRIKHARCASGQQVGAMSARGTWEQHRQHLVRGHFLVSEKRVLELMLSRARSA